MGNAHPYFSLKILGKKGAHYTWQNTVTPWGRCNKLQPTGRLRTEETYCLTALEARSQESILPHHWDPGRPQCPRFVAAELQCSHYST